MKILVLLLTLLALLVVGCSEHDTGPTGSDPLAEYDEGLNLKVTSQTETNNILIGFSMPAPGSYTLSVLNVTGYTIRSWQGTTSAGQIQIAWDGTNKDGKPVDVGLYIYELEAADLTARQVDLLGGLGS
ncbi:MAG: hypothetical protein KOO62_00845 [candidate division Zixibacteria bacterium]|nr:hypothetical protein [candidate division Zixibacteria bacterium]